MRLLILRSKLAADSVNEMARSWNAVKLRHHGQALPTRSKIKHLQGLHEVNVGFGLINPRVCM
jgi:hypothetical protein